MLKALRNRAIALLWAGQALSAIGDEVYRVALIWLAVGLVGEDAGFLGAGQCAALLTMSLIGGRWADRWDHRKTMVRVDLLRGLIVLVPVFTTHFFPLGMPLLFAVALSVSALNAFFDPALQATLPAFSPDVGTLRAATAVMGTTQRLARVAAPAVIGVLTAFLPAIHFFSLDALSFVLSALSIHWLVTGIGRRKVRADVLRAGEELSRPGFVDSMLAGFRAVGRRPGMPFIMFAKAVSGGTWTLAYSLGFALLVHHIAPHDVRAFGALVGTYGVGNLGATLVLGNMRRQRSCSLLFGGLVWMGLGFVGLALAPTLPWMMFAAFVAAMGGPMNDLPFLDLAQTCFPLTDLPRVIRLRMTLETAASLTCMLASPALFRLFSIGFVIGACGLVMAAVGVSGYILVPDSRLQSVESAQGPSRTDPVPPITA